MTTDPNTAPPDAPYGLARLEMSLRVASAKLCAATEIDAQDQAADAIRLATESGRNSPQQRRDLAADMRRTAREIEQTSAEIVRDLRATAANLTALTNATWAAARNA